MAASIALGALLLRAAVAAAPESCDVAAVGGGWAGVYFAYRLATGGHAIGVDPSGVCVFEASERLGGRTYSHTFELKPGGRAPEKFVLDVGAYRFSPDMHLPGDVILRELKLPTECYEPDCAPANSDMPPPMKFNYTAPLRRIVDGEGMPAGYATAIEGMAAKIEQLGGTVRLDMRLTDLRPGQADRDELIFADGAVVNARLTLLNLPRTPLLGLPTLRNATASRVVKMQECTKFDLPPGFFPMPKGSKSFGDTFVKAYAFYDDAWWHNDLNRTAGTLPANAFFPLNTSAGIPIGLRFSDGPVRCDAPGRGCRGFLEVFYAVVPETFYEDLRQDPEHPLGVLAAGSPGADAKLARLHAAVMEVAGPLFNEKGLPLPKAAPSLLAVGVWDRHGHGYTAPTKVYYSTAAGVNDPLAKACGVDGLTEDEYRRSVLQPSPVTHPGVFVANNDWVAQRTEDMFGDWAEESLLQAERGLHVLGVPRPAWLDAAYYKAKVSSVVGRDSSEAVLV